jgi:hypothetical protein
MLGGGQNCVNLKEYYSYPSLRSQTTPSRAEIPDQVRYDEGSNATDYEGRFGKLSDPGRANYNIDRDTHIGDSSLYARNDGHGNATTNNECSTLAGASGMADQVRHDDCVVPHDINIPTCDGRFGKLSDPGRANYYIPLGNEMIPLKKEIISLKREIIPFEREIIPLKRRMIPLRSENIPLKRKILSLKREIIPFKRENKHYPKLLTQLLNKLLNI